MKKKALLFTGIMLVLAFYFAIAQGTRCPDCHGSGKIPCRDCNYTGYITVDELDWETGETKRKSIPCYSCKGTLYLGPCTTCGGDGRIDDDVPRFREDIPLPNTPSGDIRLR